MRLSQHHRTSMILSLVIAILLIGFCGCTNVRHQAKFNENYTLKENVSIKVEKVVNDTGFTFDIDIGDMLADALEDQLLEEDLLWFGGDEPVLKMETRIIEYEKGNAFKRWMLPGWGATELSIRCQLKDDQDKMVGSVFASREVVAGGAYTIGAWQTVFKDVAGDVAEDLREQIEAQGYMIKEKDRHAKSAESPVATCSPAKIDPTEPWTGEWEVDGSPRIRGTWKMKQTGIIVKSTKESIRDFKGKVTGNRLRARIKSDILHTQTFPFVIALSPDGLSFEGVIETTSKTYSIKGKRKTGT